MDDISPTQDPFSLTRILFGLACLTGAAFLVVLPYLPLCKDISLCLGTTPTLLTPFGVLLLAIAQQMTLPDTTGLLLMMSFVFYLMAFANAGLIFVPLGPRFSGYAAALGLDGLPIAWIGVIGGFLLAYAIFYVTVKTLPEPLGMYQTFHQALSLTITSILKTVMGVIGVIKNALPSSGVSEDRRGQDSLPPPYFVYKADNHTSRK